MFKLLFIEILLFLKNLKGCNIRVKKMFLFQNCQKYQFNI